MSKKSVHGMTAEKASLVKRRGHQKEAKFNDQFGSEKYKTNYTNVGADNYISKSNPFYSVLAEYFNIKSEEDLSVSLKSSNTIQISLGNMPELTDRNKLIVSSVKMSKTGREATKVDHGISFSNQIEVLKSRVFWNKYLKKGEFLCYDSGDTYYFFLMDEVIHFIIENCNWRILDTGRLKGDFLYKNKSKQFLTYEYRSEKKSFVLGAHGGKKGKEFIELLKDNVKYYSKDVIYA